MLWKLCAEGPTKGLPEAMLLWFPPEDAIHRGETELRGNNTKNCKVGNGIRQAIRGEDAPRNDWLLERPYES